MAALGPVKSYGLVQYSQQSCIIACILRIHQRLLQVGFSFVASLAGAEDGIQTVEEGLGVEGAVRLHVGLLGFFLPAA